MNKIQAYQAAAKTRGSGLSDMIANKIIGGEGIGGSIRKSIGEKMAARSMGLREKFDPLNMASALMGRSKLGTAIAGRMMGRGGEESQYFANKGKKNPVSANKSIGGLLAPVPQENVSGATSIFEKIYELIRSQNEERVKQREKENNFKEEQDAEDEARHKRLLDAILQSKGMGKTATPTAKKEGGIFDMIKNMLSSMMETVKGMIESAINGVKEFFKGALEVGKVIMDLLGNSWKTILPRILGALAGPAGLLLIGALAAGLIGAYIWKLWKDNDPAKTQAALGSTDIMGVPLDPDMVTAKDPIKEEKTKELIKEYYSDLKAGKGYPEIRQPVLEAVRTEFESYGGTRKEELKPIIRELERRKTLPAHIKKSYGITESATPTEGSAATPSATPAGAPAAAPSATPVSSAPSSSAPTASPAPAASAEASAVPSAAPTPTVTPMPAKEGTPPALAITNENKALELERIATQYAEPIIMNKVNTIPLPTGSEETGTITGAASVRNDHLDDFLLGNMKRVSFM